MSAFLLSMYPIIFGSSRTYNLEIAETSLLCSCIYFLLLSDYFQISIYSILSGIFLGLGLITKIMFPVYIVGPIMFYLYLTFIHKNSFNKKLILNKKPTETKKFINCSTSFFLGILPFLFLFFPNINRILLFRNEFLDDFDLGFKGIFFYILRLVDSQIFLVFFIIFFIALVYLIKTKPKNYKLLIFWILVPCILLTLSNRTIRHTIPILPAIAIISSYFIYNFNNSKLKKMLIFVIILFSFLQFFFMSYFGNFTNSDYNFITSQGANLDDRAMIGGESRNIALLTANPTFINHPVKKEDWKIEEILNIIERNARGDGSIVIRFFGIGESPFFYYRTLTRRFHWVFSFSTTDFNDWYKDFDNIDFVVLREGYDPSKEEYEPVKQYVKIYNHFEKNKDKFELIKIFKMPDNSNIIVYKMKK